MHDASAPTSVVAMVLSALQVTVGMAVHIEERVLHGAITGLVADFSGSAAAKVICCWYWWCNFNFNDY